MVQPIITLAPNGDKIYTKKCSVTNITKTVTIPLKAYNAWKGGELIQLALPHLSNFDREFLISGNTQAEWEKMFDTDEDNAYKDAIYSFKQKYRALNSADLQTFTLGWKAHKEYCDNKKKE